MAKRSNKNNLSRTVNFSIGQIMVFAIIFGLVGVYAVWQSLAAPSTTGTSSIALNETDPYLGSYVSFTSVFPRLKGNITPRIAVRCYQDMNGSGTVETNGVPWEKGGDMIYASAAPYSSSQLLGGGGSEWLRRGGSATCNAELFTIASKAGTQQAAVLAKTADFQAGGAR